jgi:hypothetical protein
MYFDISINRLNVVQDVEDIGRYLLDTEIGETNVSICIVQTINWKKAVALTCYTLTLSRGLNKPEGEKSDAPIGTRM